MVQPTFNTIVELLKMLDESKYGFSTYYIKFLHVKTVFDAMIGRIGELELKSSSTTNIVFSRKTLDGERKKMNEEWHNYY